jgi:formylglycine-generating enzyme required for sulfatase activity
MVVAVLPAAKGEAERFHEVFRLVPGDQQAQSGLFPHNGWRLINEVIHLPRIDIPPADVTKNMALFPASERFLLGLGGQMLDKEGKLVPAPTRTALVPAFFLDPTEVSVLCYRHWAEGEQENAIGPQGKDDFPATSVRWDQAVACAEKAGKRLPDEVEHEYAATVCGTRRFPWGEFLDPRGVKKWSFGPVHQRGSDVVELPGQPPVLGLYSNVAEWTSSWPGSLPGAELSQMRPMLRVVRGGPMSVVNGSRELREPVQGPTERLTFVVPIGHKGLGFRGARSARPRLTANDFVTIRDR